VPITIRSASPEDVSALASLLGELGYPSDADRVRARLTRVLGSKGDNPTDSVLVATDEGSGAVLGLLSLHCFDGLHDDAPVAMITALVVAEQARGLGIGRQLVDHAIAAARRRRCTRLMLTTHVRRADAHAFYERIGFEFTGRRYVKTI
jgi:GNAT superfamily N-acetyltransferase